MYGGEQAEDVEKQEHNDELGQERGTGDAPCIFEYYEVPAEVRLLIYEYL